MLTVAMVAILASCTVTKRHYAPGYHVEWKNLSNRSHVAAPKADKAVTEENSITTFGVLNASASPDLNAVASADNNSIELNFETAVVKDMSPAVYNSLSKKEVKKEMKAAKKLARHNESSSVDIHSEKSPDALSWFIWIAAILCLPIVGGPLFILVWTSSKNGQPDWKPILTSLLLYILCWIPGLIYDIIWISKNCSGSLFND